MATVRVSLLFFFVLIMAAKSQIVLPGIEILDWEPPKDIAKKYPYYLSGYDHEGAPVWVLEFGKWDLKAAVDAGGEYLANFDKYFQQMVRRWAESSKEKHPDADPGFFVIGDLDGYNLAQAGSVKAVQKYLQLVQVFVETIKLGKLKGVYLVNANYLFQTVWRLSKPLFGQVLEDIQIFGTNTEVWKPKLIKMIPQDQLPEWYGGSKSHHPLKVYGK